MLVLNFKKVCEAHSFYFDNDSKSVMFGECLEVYKFDDQSKICDYDEISDDELKNLSDYLMEQWNKSNSDGCHFTAGDILINGCDLDESWTLSEINAEVKDFFYEMRQLAKDLNKNIKEVA
ncbi:hypothetical protein OFO01_07195 [Campylobacter sp. JMF_01 NE2]|uniref:hypothetical protein n=1 Tax=unclassified Campylobacter TaxID=2593542 RepID=UPI0022E9B93C|nr:MULTISPECIES: hypothetical protein [unclassified Campylobacter]MDA3053251.1 hypothetical protein [Campylobacter sp. JMF_03 NE3]MDA3067566.1 hypothetical protein [Campylobacter sp. JMF_01 NE2]